MTLPTGAVGGAHAGYRIYPCKDGRVAVAALEPHFAAALCEVAGVEGGRRAGMQVVHFDVTRPGSSYAQALSLLGLDS